NTGASAASAGTAGAAPRRRRGRLGGWLALAPFLFIVAVGLVAPTIAIAIGAFRQTDPFTDVTTTTTANVSAAVQGGYRTAMYGSLKLALVTAVLGAIVGVLLAYAIVTGGSSLLRRATLTASGVLANFGGVPLAFAFIATIGNAGLVTMWLHDFFGDDATLHLYSFGGLAIVYLYFLVPLVVIVVTPALDGIRPQWSEAAANLGATRWQYWRMVGGPLLAPPVTAAALLLFCGALSAFATAQAMVGATVPLITLQIANVLSGNVGPGQEGIGDALALEMIVIVGVAMVVHHLVQRRTARWLA
ncbi:MAG TPA: ABC transporter permease subunit, partial [Rugosimonospora sp.]|nr:ABC transporter permease subunit [Rugosimonospora sp.]